MKEEKKMKRGEKWVEKRDEMMRGERKTKKEE